jgi:hypothetical protein
MAFPKIQAHDCMNFKNSTQAGYLWLKPAIYATLEAELGGS